MVVKCIADARIVERNSRIRKVCEEGMDRNAGAGLLVKQVRAARQVEVRIMIFRDR